MAVLASNFPGDRDCWKSPHEMFQSKIAAMPLWKYFVSRRDEQFRQSLRLVYLNSFLLACNSPRMAWREVRRGKKKGSYIVQFACEQTDKNIHLRFISKWSSPSIFFFMFVFTYILSFPRLRIVQGLSSQKVKVFHSLGIGMNPSSSRYDLSGNHFRRRKVHLFLSQ